MEPRQTKVPAQRPEVPEVPFHTATASPCHAMFSAHTSLGSKADGLSPPLPLPGVSAYEHSHPSAHWGPAAAGLPCCLSELWSVGRTSPNLKQTEKHKEKVSHTLREQGHSHLATPQTMTGSSGAPVSPSCISAGKQDPSIRDEP